MTTKAFRVIWMLLLVSTALCAGDAKKPVEKLEIRVARYAGPIGATEETRVLIVGQTAYRSFAELTKAIAAFRGHPETHLVVYGTCDAADPRLTPEEIETLKRVCSESGRPFTYYPGG